MFPKTLPPQGYQRLSDRLREHSVMPLWEAGRVLTQLAARPERDLCPLNPNCVLLGAGRLVLLTEEPGAAPSPYLPPECNFSPDKISHQTARVYVLCALFLHILSGVPPTTGESLSRRRAKLRGLVRDLSLSQEAGELLFRLLDQGLRLEPSRRQQSVGELARELNVLSGCLDSEALRTLEIVGTAGAYMGKNLPLNFPMILGRQPGECQILFPPDTPGVSRRHCRMELCWGRVLVTDLNSSYGTYLDGIRIDTGGEAPWKQGAELWLGSELQVLKYTV